MGRVRSFTADDIPEVVRLRQKCFKHLAHLSEKQKSEYFRRIFFESPWRSDDFPSLICEEKDGTIVGFLGSIARPFRYQGSDLWMATPTQLMSDPKRGGMSGFQLMKAFLAGPQDFSLADIAASGPREIWQRLGGTTALLHSLFWTRPLRPFRLMLRDFGPSRTISAIGKAAYPIAAGLDFALARTPGNVYCLGDTGLQESRLELPVLLESIGKLEKCFSFVPIYNLDTLGWLFAELEGSDSGVKLRKSLLRDGDGNIVGWYIYCLASGGNAQTVQVWASEEYRQSVLDHMYFDAWKMGCNAVSGRCHPEFLSSLGKPPGRLSRIGPWTLVHSKNSELLRKVCDGDAWLTRLEGEWWLNF